MFFWSTYSMYHISYMLNLPTMIENCIYMPWYVLCLYELMVFNMEEHIYWWSYILEDECRTYHLNEQRLLLVVDNISEKINSTYLNSTYSYSTVNLALYLYHSGKHYSWSTIKFSKLYCVLVIRARMVNSYEILNFLVQIIHIWYLKVSLQKCHIISPFE